jgi:hypothetical protein
MRSARSIAVNADVPDRGGNRVKTVLLFAYACAPYNRPESTIGAQRPAKLAKYLTRFGWRTIVICHDGRASINDPAQLRGIVDRSLGQLRPDAPLIVPVPALKHDGPLDKAWNWASREGRRGIVWDAVRRPLTIAKFFTGDYSQSWQPAARAAAIAVAERTNVDACIGEHSPDAGLFLARWYSETHHVPWIADFRDPFLFGQRVALRPLLAPFARRMVRSATHVVEVTPPSVEIDSRLLSRRVELIENGFDPEEFEGPLEPTPEGEFAVVLTGSIWVQSDLERFLQGLALLRDRLGSEADRSLRFRYVGGDHEIVQSLAKRVGVEAIVDSRGRVPRAVALQAARGADVLLVISPLNHPDPYWAAGAYTGKVFEYLGARRPILAVPAGNRPLEALLHRTRAGTSASTPGEIAAYLEAAWRQWRSTGAVAYSPDEATLAQYSRVRSAQKMAALLDDSIATGATPSQGSTFATADSAA